MKKVNEIKDGGTNDYYTKLSSGKVVGVWSHVFGLDAYGGNAIYGGFDHVVRYVQSSEDDAPDPQDIAEIADHMIKRWQEVLSEAREKL